MDRLAYCSIFLAIKNCIFILSMIFFTNKEKRDKIKIRFKKIHKYLYK